MLFGTNRNCWFCNQYTKVSLFNRNSWTCSHCEQYNGFDENGDYNREIPEMYQHSKPLKFNTFFSWKKPFCSGQKNSFLCNQCNDNQKLKIEKLSHFQPQREETFDLEIQLYNEYMEKIYDLCDKCKSKVKFEITRQDGILKQYLYKIGKFDYLFERNVFGQRFPNLCTKAITHMPKFFPYAKLFLYFLTLIICIVTILSNNYKSNSGLIKYTFYFSPSLLDQVQKIALNFSSLISNSNSINLNSHLPLLICLNYIILCASLIIEKENFKGLILLLSLNTTLIMSNYHIIYQSLHNSQDFPINLKVVPECTLPMILILIIQLKNSKSKSPVQKVSPKGSIIPNLQNKCNQMDKIIKPAKFKPLSRSLFDFKPTRASLGSSDLSLNPSRSSDDESSSIVSGLTNLYLDRSRDINESIKYDFGLVQSNDSNHSSYYQFKNSLRNRSVISSKWQPSHISKKEIFVVY